MPRKVKRPPGAENLTALRALPLLVNATQALGGDNVIRLREALRNCQSALQNHVRAAVWRGSRRA